MSERVARKMDTPSADPRLTALADWLAGVLGSDRFTLSRASEDASFRRYFRIALGSDRTLIAMDAPPPMEDCRPFVHVAALLRDAGVHAPQIHAQDLDRGFLLLEDLGTTTYLARLDAANAHELYLDAIDALVRFQRTSREGVLPDYDEALLRREIDLFPDWYVAKHVGRMLDERQRASLEGVFARVIANNLAQPRVFVHRDYHSRNLMVCERNPGVLDFQDAVYGPVTYDLVSLLRDAYVAWEEERQIDWAVRYWERARAAGIAVDPDFGNFWRDFEWMGVQRHIKVLGIFARLCHRDGKSGYVNDMPLVMRYLRGACGRYRELAPMIVLLDALEGREPVVGYTF
jgi:aminoglycoside/choline kinase family phosphotransferase